MTIFAAEPVRFGTAGEGHEIGLPLIHGPTPVALVIDPDLDLKIRKALLREVRRFRVVIYLRQARLNLFAVALVSRKLRLKIVHKLYQGLLQVVGHRHG
jgi:hypothetical protein